MGLIDALKAVFDPRRRRRRRQHHEGQIPQNDAATATQSLSPHRHHPPTLEQHPDSTVTFPLSLSGSGSDSLTPPSHEARVRVTSTAAFSLATTSSGTSRPSERVITPTQGHLPIMPHVIEDVTMSEMHNHELAVGTRLSSLATLYIPTAGSSPLPYRNNIGIIVRNLHARQYGFKEEQVQDLVLEALRYLLTPNYGPSVGMPGFLFSKNVSLVTDIRVPGGTPGMDTRVNRVLRWLAEHARADMGKKRLDFGTGRIEQPDIVLIGRSDLRVKTALNGSIAGSSSSASRRNTDTVSSSTATTGISTSSTGSRKRRSFDLSPTGQGKRQRRARDPQLAAFVQHSADTYWAAESLKLEVKLCHIDMIVGQTLCYALIGFDTCGSRASLLLYRTRFTPILVLDHRTIAMETSQEERWGQIEAVAAWRAAGAVRASWLPHDLDRLNRAEAEAPRSAQEPRREKKGKGKDKDKDKETALEPDSHRPRFLQLPPADLVHLPSLEQLTRFVVSCIRIAAPIDLDARLDWQALQSRSLHLIPSTSLSLATKLTANTCRPNLLPAYQTSSGSAPVKLDPEQLESLHDLAVLCRMSRPELAQTLKRLFPDSAVVSSVAPGNDDDDDDDGDEDLDRGLGRIRKASSESLTRGRGQEDAGGGGGGNGHRDHRPGPSGVRGADRDHDKDDKAAKNTRRKDEDGRPSRKSNENGQGAGYVSGAGGGGYTTRKLHARGLEGAGANSGKPVPLKYGAAQSQYTVPVASKYCYDLGMWLGPEPEPEFESESDLDTDAGSEANADAGRRPDGATMMRLQRTLTPGKMYWAGLELLGVRVHWVRPGGLVEAAERMAAGLPADKVAVRRHVVDDDDDAHV